VTTYPVLEHRQRRSSRWLRENRLRIALLVALVETGLVVANVLAWRWAVIAAGIVFAFHFFVGRRASYDTVRQLSWAGAVSQTLPVLLPFVAVAVSALVVLGVLAAAVVVIAFLVFGRR
jgi:hypothetical protein